MVPTSGTIEKINGRTQRLAAGRAPPSPPPRILDDELPSNKTGTFPNKIIKTTFGKCQNLAYGWQDSALLDLVLRITILAKLFLECHDLSTERCDRDLLDPNLALEATSRRVIFGRILGNSVGRLARDGGLCEAGSIVLMCEARLRPPPSLRVLCGVRAFRV